MLCFRCGAHEVDDATACVLCGQRFVDQDGHNLSGVSRRPSDPHFVPDIFHRSERVAGRFEIGPKISISAEGVFYLAKDNKYDSDVLLQAILPSLMQTKEEQNRFLYATKLARNWHHDQWITPISAGIDQGRGYLVFAHAEATPLADLWLQHKNEGRFAVFKMVRDIFTQIGQALNYLHPKIVAGLLNPNHIVLVRGEVRIVSGNLLYALPMRPYLASLKLRSDDLTYVAPEIRSLAPSVDHRADIFSLGQVLDVVLRHAPLETIPDSLTGIVKRSTAAHPDRRYADIGSFGTALSDALKVILDEHRMKPLMYSFAVDAPEATAVDAAASSQKNRLGYAAAVTSGVFVLLATLLIGARTILTVREKIHDEPTPTLSFKNLPLP